MRHKAFQRSASDCRWLPETVMRGQNDVAKVLGCSVFEYLGQNEEAARMFSAAMTDLSTPVIRDAVATIAIGDARSVVDIGGADGAFVAQHWAGT